MGVTFVFAVAFCQRLEMPWLPLADPDTWGYVNPALEHLAGNGMLQTHCRGLAYPLFLRSLLGACGSFASIALAQHLLGLMSGLCWLAAFRFWLVWLPGKYAQSALAWWCAAACVALYLCNPATLAFESQIRPEAVFPFFCLAQIATTLAFLRARWGGGPAGLLLLTAAGSTLLAAVCLSLKPSWGFAGAVPFGVILLGALRGGVRVTRLVRAGPVVAAAVALVFWLNVVPRIAGWVPDMTCGSFMAGTLFTVHADIIAREMHDRAARGRLDAEELRFLEKLDTRIAESRKLEKSAYLLLGHDADYLFYYSDALANLPRVPAGDSEMQNSYLRMAYLNAVFAEPVMVASKVMRQLESTYGDASKSVFMRSVQWRPLFERTYACLNDAQLPELPGHLQESFSHTLGKLKDSTPLQPPMLEAPYAPPRWFFRGVVSWVLTGIVLLGGVAICASPWLGRMNVGGGFVPALRAFAVVWASSFGSALTVAVVHSFDIDRYGMLQSSVNSLLLATGATFMILAILTFRQASVSSPESCPDFAGCRSHFPDKK